MNEVNMADQPQRTALYRLYGEDDRLLYIGISSNPKVRWQQHKTTKEWWSAVTRKSVEWFASRTEAEVAERTAIRDESPIHNFAHAAKVMSDPYEPGISGSERRRRLLGDALYERVVREAREWAAQCPPLTEDQQEALRAILRPAPQMLPARRAA